MVFKNVITTYILLEYCELRISSTYMYLIVICMQTATPKCPAKEKWDDCGKPQYCLPTCSSPNVKACPRMCSRGCYCERGLIRDDNGKCVRPERCEGKLHNILKYTWNMYKSA